MVQVRQLNPAAIYAARLKAGITQEDLAHRLRARGVNAAARYINRWERGPDRGGNTPRADVVPALADALGVSIDSLYELSSTEDEEDDLSRIRRVRAELVLAGRDDLADDLLKLSASFAGAR